ncbi:MAG: 5'-methylthioadenosine/S-adenosylhomocysteine nucleosidase [Verrucomicrobia bacterium]|nr:5'-methylthioadenosine/S-adenosylhomocysteine nucleosidase [Cytophagales bacterium]
MKLILTTVVFVLLFATNVFAQKTKYAVIISANMEWKAIKKAYPAENYQLSVWGEFFFKKIQGQKILFFHEGWGKVAAAGATQYVIDHYKPEFLINLGTCGGFEGEIERLDIVLADKTIIYDIIEAMGDSKEAIADYTTTLNLEWLGNTYPTKVRKTTLVSADKDLRTDEIEKLKSNYQAVAGDWESGAIAYTAHKNKIKQLILRGVSDLVSSQKGEAYGDFALFEQRAEIVMLKLLDELPKWIAYIERLPKNK